MKANLLFLLSPFLSEWPKYKEIKLKNAICNESKFTVFAFKFFIMVVKVGRPSKTYVWKKCYLQIANLLSLLSPFLLGWRK
jgi:hypothetical protein